MRFSLIQMMCEGGKIIPTVNGTIVEDTKQLDEIEESVAKLIADCGIVKGIYGIDVESEGSLLFVLFVILRLLGTYFNIDLNIARPTRASHHERSFYYIFYEKSS